MYNSFYILYRAKRFEILIKVCDTEKATETFIVLSSILPRLYSGAKLEI